MTWKRPEQLRQKVLPMKVLNFGMSRSGTTSMCTALQKLGCVACYHLNYDSDDCAFWLAAMEAKFEGKGEPFGKAEWDHIFSDFDAMSDLPAILFAPELAAAYPEAKILLSVRDVNSWYRSMLATVCNPIYQGWYHRFPAWFFSKEKALCDMSDKCEQIAWQNDFATHGKEYYLKYNDSIRKLVPSEANQPLEERRFLEWQLGEGWTRLAKFLKQDVPPEPYPSGNSVAEFVDEADDHAREMWLATGQKLLSWSIIGAGLTVSIMTIRAKLRKVT